MIRKTGVISVANALGDHAVVPPGVVEQKYRFTHPALGLVI
jgi:hypothetical protein